MTVKIKEAMIENNSLKEIFDKAEYKKVSKQEFEEFVKNYPRKLLYDVTGICEPPAVSYNDFELGKWPESVVASTFACCDDKNNSWRIMVNHEEIYAAVQEFKATHDTEGKSTQTNQEEILSPLEEISENNAGNSSSPKLYIQGYAELIICDPKTGKEVYRKIVTDTKFSTGEFNSDNED